MSVISLMTRENVLRITPQYVASTAHAPFLKSEPVYGRAVEPFGMCARQKCIEFGVRVFLFFATRQSRLARVGHEARIRGMARMCAFGTRLRKTMMIATAIPAPAPAPVPTAPTVDAFDEFLHASQARCLGAGAYQEGVRAVHIENSFGHADGRLTAMRATVGSARSPYQAIDGVVDAHAFRVALPASYLEQGRSEALATMQGLGEKRVDLYVEDWRAGGARSVSYKVGHMRIDAVAADHVVLRTAA